MNKTVSIGEISSGTMLPRHLIPTFLSELDDEQANKIIADYPEYEEDEDSEFWDSEESSWMLETLFDALDGIAPAYCYFGSLEGDGACYGFWPSVESLEDDCRNGDVLKVVDLGEMPHGYNGFIMQASDHGNVTLYEATNGDAKEVWSVV